MLADVTNWEKVTAVATAVGGVGAMLGAIFAWLAARSSGKAARDATDALAGSLKPQLHIAWVGGSQTPVEARAVVMGPLSPVGLAGVLPAADVKIEYSLASGRHGVNNVAVLEPNGDRWAREEPYLGVVIGEPGEDWPLVGGDFATVTVTFSDSRRVARYQQTVTCDLHPAHNGPPGIVSFQYPSEPDERRIS
jgi:hypothetical protein